MLQAARVAGVVWLLGRVKSSHLWYRATMLQRAILFTKNLAGMSSFYATVTGLRPSAETATPSWVELQSHGSSLALHAIPPALAVTISITTPPRPRTDTAIKLVFAVPDVAAAQARVVELGGLLLATADGSSDCADPEGNVFRMEVSG